MAESISNFQISQSFSNRIESYSGFEFESNLEASQVPNGNVSNDDMMSRYMYVVTQRAFNYVKPVLKPVLGLAVFCIKL